MTEDVTSGVTAGSLARQRAVAAGWRIPGDAPEPQAAGSGPDLARGRAPDRHRVGPRTADHASAGQPARGRGHGAVSLPSGPRGAAGRGRRDIMDELYDHTMTGDPPGSWQEYFQRMAHGVRGICVAHPRIFPLVASRPPAAPWLRPPLREPSLGGGFPGLAAALRLQRPRTASASTERSRPSCSATCCWNRPQRTIDRRRGLDDDIQFFETNDLSEYPRLFALEGPLPQDGFAEEFEDALEDLINRIELLFD